MEIEYHLTEADIIELLRYRLSQVPRRRNPVMFRQFAYLIGFMLISFGSLLIAKNVVLPLIFLVLGIFSFLTYPTYFDWRVRRKVAAIYRDETKGPTLGTRILRTTDEGIEEKSSLGEIKIKWEVIDNIAVTPAYTIISIQSSPLIIIPQNGITSGDYESFVEECRRDFWIRSGSSDAQIREDAR